MTGSSADKAREKDEGTGFVWSREEKTEGKKYQLSRIEKAVMKQIMITCSPHPLGKGQEIS